MIKKKIIKILIVDDEPDILEFLKYNLVKEGYSIILAEDGMQGIEKAKEEKPDLIILDLMMPGMDGIEVCQVLRENPLFKTTLIVFMTARNEDYSQVAGFEAGADDYIIKPISLKVFIARVNALIKRGQSPVFGNTIAKVSDVVVDKEKRIVYKKNEAFEFPKKEFELINLLISKPGKVFTREEIYDKLWGNDVIVSDRSIDVYIRKIREKLGDYNIKTIKGIGYRFEVY